MALQEKASLDGQEVSLGQRSGQQAQRLQGNSEDDVQKKTFTRWMNVFLRRCEPPIEVQDLFTDIQDGRVLLALLEELSGCKLLYRFRPSSHRIFRLNNISKALAFLDDRHVKLLYIDASGIADGIPTVVLNLTWNVILFFQIKELTRGLQKRLSSSLSSLSISSYPSSSDLSPQSDAISTYSSSTLPSKGRRAARTPKYHGKAIKTLLHWVQRCTSKFGVEVYDFGKSWMSGLAFLAIIKSIDPGLVDLRDSLPREPRENVQEAFRIAQHSLGIPPLLDPEDLTHNSPDEQSIITYVSMFLEHYSGLDECIHLDCGSSISIPEIPHFGETFDRHPDAQASFPSQPKTNEQLLWKRWSTSSREHAASSPLNGQLTSDPTNDKSMASSHNLKSRGTNTDAKKGCRNSVSVIPPNSPLGLDIDTVHQVLWTRMEKTTADQASSQLCVDEGNFSQSSEEGVYNLSVLDSDEEDAYSYILDLNKEALPSSNELNGRAPGVDKMETTAGMISSLRLTRESKALSVSEVLVNNGRGRDYKRQEAFVTQTDDFKRPFADGAQSRDKGNIDAKANGDGVNDNHRRKGECIRGEDEGSMVGLREMVNNGERCDMDEELEDYDISEEESEEEEERGGYAKEYNFEDEEADADDEEEEEDRESDRGRAAGEGMWEKWEEKEEELEEKEDGSSREEDRAENVDNCEEEEEEEKESVMGANCKEEDGEEEENEVEDTERNRTVHIEDEEENGGMYAGLLGDEAGRVVDHVFREEGGNRTEEIVVFRGRFGEGLAIIEDNPREGFDKEEERDTEDEEEEDKVESAELSEEEEELKEGDEEEIASGDFGVSEWLKEVGEKELVEEEEESELDVGKGEEEEEGREVEEGENKEGREPEEAEEVKRAEEVRRAEEEGEIIEEKAEEEENIASSAGLKVVNQEMFSDDVAHRVRETAEGKAMFELDEGTATEEEKVAGEREETDSEEEQDRRQAQVRMKDRIIKVDKKEGGDLLGGCGDEEDGEEQDNHVTNAKHYEEMVMTVEDDKEKMSRKLMTVEEATGRGHSNEITLEKNIMTCRNHHHHHHHHHYNIHPNWTSACSGTSQTSSEESGIPDSLAPSFGVTQSELELLLALWMLLYCYFILPEINL